MNKLLFRLAMSLLVLALASSVVLLASGADPGGADQGHHARVRWAAVISGLPLLTAGLSFSLIQLIIRPPRAELLRNLLLAATFLLWGAVQLMTQNFLSKKLGDVVIALYVSDLAWTILAGRNPMRRAS
jgi:uncharacterized membrane protein HdeD (DUF308 family)